MTDAEISAIVNGYMDDAIATANSRNGGAGITIATDNNFTTETLRNTYFTTYPAKLTDSMYVTTAGILQHRVSNDWINSSVVVQGGKGDTGSQGTAGVSVTSGTVNPSGHLIITKSDTATIDAGLVKGDKGDTGLQGLTGNTGLTGIKGDTGTGLQGIQGIQGIAGVSGASGINWRNAWSVSVAYAANDAVGYNGSSYYCTVGCTGVLPTSTINWQPLSIMGATGQQGIQGIQGVKGDPGTSVNDHVQNTDAGTTASSFIIDTTRNTNAIVSNGAAGVSFKYKDGTDSPMTLSADTTIGTVTPVEILCLDGVTSNVQTQVDAKAPKSSPTFTGTTVLPATTSIGTVSAAEILCLDNVTSNIQTQLNAKAPSDTPTFTGNALFTGLPTSSAVIAADTNNTRLATTAFVVGQASSTLPSANGTASIGTSLRYARADHVHAGGSAISYICKIQRADSGCGFVANAWTNVTFNAKPIDPANMGNTVNSFVSISVAGIYEVTGQVAVASNTTLVVSVQQNSTGITSAQGLGNTSTGSTVANFSTIIQAMPGDSISLMALATTNSASASTNGGSYLIVKKIG